jgi:type III restriction enzyme
LKEIIFNDLEGNFSHKTIFKNSVPDFRNVISFFTKSILVESRLVTGFDILYPKLESFIKYKLFENEVELSNSQTIRNLSEIKTKEILRKTFKEAIDKLTVLEKGNAKIQTTISLRQTKTKIAENQSFLIPKKSVFNKIIGDNNFELEFASFLESKFNDVTAFAKNTIGEGGVNFRIEYQAENGNIREYYPDFFVKTKENTYFVVETKGREDLDDLRKISRLKTWCNDINLNQEKYSYTPVYVKQEKWDKIKNELKSFDDIIKIFEVKNIEK